MNPDALVSAVAGQLRARTTSTPSTDWRAPIPLTPARPVTRRAPAPTPSRRASTPSLAPWRGWTWRRAPRTRPSFGRSWSRSPPWRSGGRHSSAGRTLGRPFGGAHSEVSGDLGRRARARRRLDRRPPRGGGAPPRSGGDPPPGASCHQRRGTGSPPRLFPGDGPGRPARAQGAPKIRLTDSVGAHSLRGRRTDPCAP